MGSDMNTTICIGLDRKCSTQLGVPPVTDFMDGFALGVQYYNKVNGTDVEVLGWDPQRHDGLFVGGFCCAAQGRETTQQLLALGADVILPVAGTNVGPGAEYAVKEHGNSYIIGVDTDWAQVLSRH
jgi:basic membrane protein A and related proteins